MHELLTGRRLFKRNSPYETYQAVIECNVPPPSKLNIELDPALDAIVMKARREGQGRRAIRPPRRSATRCSATCTTAARARGPARSARFFDAALRAGDRGARRAHARADRGPRRTVDRRRLGRRGRARPRRPSTSAAKEDELSLSSVDDRGSAAERCVARSVRRSSADGERSGRRRGPRAATKRPPPRHARRSRRIRSTRSSSSTSRSRATRGSSRRCRRAR